MGVMNRGAFVAGMAASAALAASPSRAQAAARIDVHNHVGSPLWREAVGAKKMQTPANLTSLMEHTAPRMIEDMDKVGTAAGVLSVTAPGTFMGDVPECIRLSRDANEFGAGIVRQYPRRFGFWATLPMPDPNAALKELAYGLDTLKADGISIFTSYGDKYLGDKSFDPIFEELNRRSAVVFVHPGSPVCCHDLVHGVNDTVIEAQTDTTRAIAGYVFSGAAHRYPNVRMIFVHGGGTTIAVNERLVLLAKSPDYANAVPEGFLAALSRFYFDVATVSNGTTMAAVRRLVPVSHLVFGTDYPFRGIADQAQALSSSGVFNAAEVAAISRANAVTLLPRLA